jgi:quercetin dioxygenase-like cupin family protein
MRRKLFISFRHHDVEHNGRPTQGRWKELHMPNLRPFVWALTGIFAFLSLHAIARPGVAQEAVTPLLDAGKTVLGQPLVYPKGTPNVMASVVVMQPGEETGWHQHDVPMLGYILEGEVMVDYGPYGKRLYRKGDAILEAVGIPHRGRNTGSVPARIMSVFMGAKGTPNTTLLPGYFPQ